MARSSDNKHFYGRKVTLPQVLNGKVEVPAGRKEPIDKLHLLIVERTYGKHIAVAIAQAKRTEANQQVRRQNSIGIELGAENVEAEGSKSRDEELVSSGKQLLKAVLESDKAEDNSSTELDLIQFNEAPSSQPSSQSSQSFQRPQETYNYGIKSESSENFAPVAVQQDAYNYGIKTESSGNFAPVAVDEVKGEEVFSLQQPGSTDNSDKVVLVQDHVVAEDEEQYQAHNIGKISESAQLFR